MHFLIADSFTESLAQLVYAEQNKVKTADFDLQLDPARPILRIQPFDRARDRNHDQFCGPDRAHTEP